MVKISDIIVRKSTRFRPFSAIEMGMKEFRGHHTYYLENTTVLENTIPKLFCVDGQDRENIFEYVEQRREILV